MFFTSVYFVTTAIVGLLIGSFLNVVIYRGPSRWGLLDREAARGTLATPRSYCPGCKTTIKPVHLVPIFGYLFLRGKCANCASPISVRYPIVEILGAAAAVCSVMLFDFTVTALLASVFFWFLIALGAVDWETGYLPDALTFPLIAIGLIVNIFGSFVPFMDAAIGAVVGYGAFRLIDIVFLKIRGMEGLGQGDAKLLAALGAWLGWFMLAPVVFCAAFIALIGVMIARLNGNEVQADSVIAFGPALAAAGALLLIINALMPSWLF